MLDEARHPRTTYSPQGTLNKVSETITDWRIALDSDDELFAATVWQTIPVDDLFNATSSPIHRYATWR